MPLIDKPTLISKLSPPFDPQLATQLVDEFVDLERRYILRDWGPAELDGARFCEVLARILYHLDSRNLNASKDYDDCRKYIENDQVPHHIARDDAKMLFMVATVVHKFRSKRGVGHVSPKYSANHMDARYMMEAVRWAMVETLRLFWAGDRDAAAKAVQELLCFDVPCIGRIDEVVLVQRTDLSAEEEILVLLHYAGTNGYTRNDLGTHAKVSPSSVTRAIESLASPSKRELVKTESGKFKLSDLGHKRLREQLASKLLIE